MKVLMIVSKEIELNDIDAFLTNEEGTPWNLLNVVPIPDLNKLNEVLS